MGNRTLRLGKRKSLQVPKPEGKQGRQVTVGRAQSGQRRELGDHHFPWGLREEKTLGTGRQSSASLEE